MSKNFSSSAHFTTNWLIPSPESSDSSNFNTTGSLQNNPFNVSTSLVRVALIKIVCTPFGIALATFCRSSSYPYDRTKSASSMTRCARWSRERAEVLILRDARAGVAITMSGKSARRDLCTASETLCVMLTARMSFAQKEENDSTAL